MPIAQVEVISRRLSCLYIHFLRGWAEVKHARHPDGKSFSWKLTPKEVFEACQIALVEKSLRSEFTAREKNEIATKLGKLAHFKAGYATYRAEPIQVLAWCMNRASLPLRFEDEPTLPYQELPIQSDLVPALNAWLARPKLLPVAQLRRRQLFESAWAWRARIADFPLGIGLAEPDESDETFDADLNELLSTQIRKCAQTCQQKRFFTVRNGDFPYERTTFGRAWNKGISRSPLIVATERLRAINWVLKPSQSWHKVPTPTPFGFDLPKRFLGKSWFIRQEFEPRDESSWTW